MNDTLVNGVDAQAEPGPMTFDKMASAPSSGKEKEVEAVEETEEVGSEEAEGQVDDSSDKEAQVDPEEEGDSEGEGEDVEDSTKEEKARAANSSTKKAKGPVKYELNGEIQELDPEAKFTFKSKDGKEFVLSAKQLGDNVMVRSEIDRRFSEVDKERKKVESQRVFLERDRKNVDALRARLEENEERIELIAEAIKTGSFYDVAQAALNVFSDSSTDVQATIYQQIKQFMDDLSTLDDNQIKAVITNSQLQFQNKKFSKELEKHKKRGELSQKKEWLSELIAKNDVDWPEYMERYQALKALDDNREKQGLPRRIKDSMSYEEIAQEVLSFTLNTRFYTKVVNLVHKVDKAAVEDNRLITEIMRLTDPDTSDKDMEDIIRGVLQVPAKKVSVAPKAAPKEVKAGTAPIKKAPATTKATPGKVLEGKRTEDDDEGPMTFGKIIQRAESRK